MSYVLSWRLRGQLAGLFGYSIVGNELRIYGRRARKSSIQNKDNTLKTLLASLRKPAPKPALPAGERLYAIGDIHGRLDLFEALLTRIERDNAGRGDADVTILLLGDLVDRGPDSRAVVERAMGWNAGFAAMESLLGNHEASFFAMLKGDTRWLDSWLGYGGRETLISYGVEPGLLAVGDEDEIVAAAQKTVSDAHRDWLEARPLKLQRGDYLFAHAGIRPDIAIEDQEAKDLLWIRGEFLDSKADHGAVIVHGHSITTEPDQQPNRIGIDTGAYFSDTLTALGLEGEERWFLQT